MFHHAFDRISLSLLILSASYPQPRALVSPIRPPTPPLMSPKQNLFAEAVPPSASPRLMDYGTTLNSGASYIVGTKYYFSYRGRIATTRFSVHTVNV